MSKKDNSVKVRICILNKQNSSINFSIRLKEGLTIDEINQEINKFVKNTLTT